MRLNLKQLQELAKKKGLTVHKTNGTLYKYEIYKPVPVGAGLVTKPKTGIVFARSAGEAELEIQEWNH